MERYKEWQDRHSCRRSATCRKINIGGAIRQERIDLVYTYRLQQGIKKGRVPIRRFDGHRFFLPTTASDIQCEPHSQKFRHHFR